MSEVQKLIDKLNKQSPEWETIVYDYYEEKKGLQGKEETVLQGFLQLIDAIVKEVREKHIGQEEALEPFKDMKCAKVIQVFLIAELRLFWACFPIVGLEKENYYEVEELIDVVWDQYVLRFSGEELKNRKYRLTEDEFEEFCMALDSFVDDCVQMQLSAKAIYSKLEDEVKLSASVCRYLTEKIERDWTELKLNYIIKQLRILRNK